MVGKQPRFGGDEATITILQVSDLQFGKHHRFADANGGFDTLLRRLCDDLDLLRDQNGLRPDLIALTGDLTEWGMKREFEQVAAFGEGLLAHLKLDPDRLLVIPGNHDINRNLCQAYFLRCAGEGEAPRPPYWPKWEPYIGLLSRLYRDVDRYRFTELEPWTLFEIPSLKVVVAGLNSTIRESHRDEDHHGFVGEAQLRAFSNQLAEYEDKGWLRIGLVHHNALRRAVDDDENLKDADDLREILSDRLHVLLHGHTHQGRVEMLGPSLPVISTGSAAVKRDQRPGPSPDLPGEIPNQYHLVRITRAGLWCAAREYTYERKRWIGDTRVSKHGDCWWYSLEHAWPSTEATFRPSVSAVPLEDGDADLEEDEGEDLRPRHGRGTVDDLLNDVIGWCRIRDEGKVAEVTRIRHRGPWGDYAKVHDRERGIGLLGAYHGEFTAEVLDRWVADVHEPFRGRGQAVSRLVVATASIDSALRAAAQTRGVDVERMIDYQRVLDTVGYDEKLRDQLAKDRRYPSDYYLEQRMTVWSPVHASRDRVERAADWLSSRLLEREGTFVLVLGPAGVGKTFLLREVTRRLGKQQAITPILVELRDLERAHTIEELAATQFTRFGVPWHPKAFRRDLEEGRLALLFDGFDELALRVRPAAIPAHFERIYAAAVERARIVVSSRTEHFLSSGQIADLMTPSSPGTTSLGGMLERVQRRLVLEIHPFERDDVATYLRRRLGDSAGEARLARLASIHDLVGLACNPRMLGFLVDIPEDKLEHATGMGGSITSDALYRMVIDDAWLAAEAERLTPPGAAPGPDMAALRDAATHLAVQLWRDPAGSIQTEDIGAHAGSLLARMCDDDPEWATQTARARTLLTRDDRGRIGFIHQTVLEWLVTSRLADEIAGGLSGNHLDVGHLNAFMIALLRQRLGDETLARWAEERLAALTASVATENARDVLKHLGREAKARAIHRDKDLRGQQLEGQTLVRAILDGADLTNARLVGRDLTGASLMGAQLAYADFTDACLKDADLTNANLAFARFHRADLSGARIDGARLTGSSFVGARAAPELSGTNAVGVALANPTSVKVMHAQAMGRECYVAFSPDGLMLASGHSDGTVRLWDCVRGQLIRILTRHYSRVLCVAFSPDAKMMASGGADRRVRLWNVEDGRELTRPTTHRGRVVCLAFSSDGKTIASGATDGSVYLSNIENGSELPRLIGHRRRTACIAFSPDGTTVASATADDLRLWSMEDGSELADLDGHLGRITCVAFSPDGKMVASGATDKTVRLWKASDGSEQARLLGHREGITGVAFSPDGKMVASSAADQTVRLWNTQEGTERVRLGTRTTVKNLAFSPDGKTMAGVGSDHTVRLWNAGDTSERMRLVAHSEPILGVAFSLDGATVTSVDADSMVRLWNIRNGNEHARPAWSRRPVTSVIFSLDGKTVASVDTDDTVRLWNTEDGNDRMHPVSNRDILWAAAPSPDGRMLAIAAEDAAIRLLNVEDGREQLRLGGHSRSAGTVAFSPDGKMIASGAADNTVRLWDANDGGERACLTGHKAIINSVTFSADGKILASGSDDGTVRLWNTVDGSELKTLIGHDGGVQSLAFSPKGKLVASGGEDHTVRLWGAADERRPARLKGHAGSVRCVAFSPDGTLLASGSDDGTMRLWGVASRRCLAILYASPSGSVAARPDGRYRVSGNIAGQFWHVIGLHRYDVGELDALIPGLRLADDEPLYMLT